MRVVSGAEAARAVRDLYGAPVRCLSPYPYMYVPGEVRKIGPAGFVERASVPCGYCRVCVATRKSNWTGRLIAEALTSASVAFVTLTYRDTPQGFVYSDIQQMLKRFRMALFRERGIHVRFFCSGERGEKRGRHHWHLLLFFDKPHQMRRTRKRQLWHFWPHGWAHIQMLKHDGSDNMLRKIRYTAKYCVKDAAHPERETFMRCSLKPGIGGKYFADLAVSLASRGLPALGGYRFKGVEYRRGPKAGQAIEFRLTGNMARNFCDAYDSAWNEFHDAPVPASRFRQSFADNFVRPYRNVVTEWRKLAQNSITVQGKRATVDGHYEARFFVRVGRDVTMIEVGNGVATVYDANGTFVLVNPAHGIETVYDGFAPEDLHVINGWLKQQWSKVYGEIWAEGGPVKPALPRNSFSEANSEQRERYKSAQRRSASAADASYSGASEAARIVGNRASEAARFASGPIWGRAQAESFARKCEDERWSDHDAEFASEIAAE